MTHLILVRAECSSLCSNVSTSHIEGRGHCHYIGCIITKVPALLIIELHIAFHGGGESDLVLIVDFLYDTCLHYIDGTR